MQRHREEGRKRLPPSGIFSHICFLSSPFLSSFPFLIFFPSLLPPLLPSSLSSRNTIQSWAGWHVRVVTESKRLRQGRKILGYKVRSCLNTKPKPNQDKQKNPKTKQEKVLYFLSASAFPLPPPPVPTPGVECLFSQAKMCYICSCCVC